MSTDDYGQHQSDCGLLIANSNPAPSREAEYNRWHEMHLQEAVRSIGGLTVAQRYRLSEHQRPDAKPSLWSYLTLYELQGDVDVIHDATRLLRDSGVHALHDSAIVNDYIGHVYTPIGNPYRKPGWTGRHEVSHIMVVRSNPVPGRDDEYNQWYAIHLREVVDNIDGYVGAQRYRLHLSQGPGVPASRWEYVAIYEIASDDLILVHRSNYAARAAGVFTPWAGILADDHVAHVFTLIGTYHR
ncbi:MAG TPA: hypothetical protein VKY90_05750 [Candidatus Dormibacteraeota bacterium]|nr:hypothetical protein [Candidatus Dormibacteraeota bacterium]